MSFDARRPVTHHGRWPRVQLTESTEGSDHGHLTERAEPAARASRSMHMEDPS